ncbi:RiPP maturation radical SAM C-methyltransferase [Streptomyces sp. NPDC127038]|uniref:RiPP maturation radical SAM C-methyltransferase n=1 Tax=Streptomyces sp. NPDC127038 TaxID=3347114 RepID=UPI00364CA6C5
MRVLLVNMPWAPIEVPSLALGILRNRVAKTMPDVEIDVLHANLDFVDWITERVEFHGRDYYYYSLVSYFKGCGDWVFSSALYDDPEWRLDEFRERLGPGMSESELALSEELHALAPLFVTELARRIADLAPDVVGFTSTFQQNAAALAAARHIKRLVPGTVTIFGGANCDGEQGAALHRNFDFVDYVVRGEGEAAFPQFLTALRDGEAPSAVPGLCWRDEEGRAVANAMSARPLPPGDIESPDYDGYFERLYASKACGWVEPKLVLEGARGCWWGEKHHCTFCGLNGSFMEFRSKSPGKFFDELVDLVRRHQVLDIFVVDNILDMAYVKSVLPRIVEAGYDLRVQYEIKSNMRYEQIGVLAEAGLMHVQPGIESLNSRVLKLMDKGVTGCHNVRMMRDAETHGLTVSWNYLFGFPGESDADYDDVIAQMPALHHLYPAGGSSRIAIERFSPYFNQPERGFAERHPDPQYSLIYDLPESELAELAYLFSSPPQGIGKASADRLEAALETWKHAYPYSRLTFCDLGDAITLVSRRNGFDWTVLRLEDPLELSAFRLLGQPHSPAALARKLSADPERIGELLARWRRLGLVFTESGTYVQIAAEARNQEVLRIAREHDGRGRRHGAETPELLPA